MNIFKILVLCFSLFCAQFSYAEEESLTDVSGAEVALKFYDHTLAGSIKDFVIWGALDCQSKVSELIMRKHGQTIKTDFTVSDKKKFEGTIEHKQASGESVKTHIVLEEFNHTNMTMTLSVNDKPYTVQIIPEATEGMHFINPQFRIFNGDKEILSFKVAKGETCPGLSAKLAMVIIGAYLHP